MKHWRKKIELFQVSVQPEHYTKKWKFPWSKLWIWSHLLKKSLIEIFVFCAVALAQYIERVTQRCSIKSYSKTFCKIHTCWKLLHNKVAGCKSAVVLGKRLRRRCFPVSFTKFFRTAVSGCFWAQVIQTLSIPS